MTFININDSLSQLHATRRVFEIFKANDINVPAIHHYKTSASDTTEIALELGTKIGSLLTDGNGDGILIEQDGDTKFSVEFLRNLGFSLLQGCRMRNTKTEFVSCPSCGRAQVDVYSLAEKVQAGLQGMTVPLRVAVMGCVVNGPGEAREADLGVASGNGKGQIFVKGEVIKTVPEAQIVETLIEEAMRLAEEMEAAGVASGEPTVAVQ